MFKTCLISPIFILKMYFYDKFKKFKLKDEIKVSVFGYQLSLLRENHSWTKHELRRIDYIYKQVHNSKEFFFSTLKYEKKKEDSQIFFSKEWAFSFF